MKILDKHLIKTFLGPFILTFFITLFIFEMQFLWKYIEDLVGKGLDWWVIVKLFGFASAALVSMALPLAVLLSSIMTFGNLGENNELVALKSAGISLRRIMAPLFSFIIILAIGAFFFSNNVLPRANLKFKTMLYDIMRKKPALDFTPGVFYNSIDNYTIRIRDKDEENNILKNILIYDHSGNKGNRRVISAREGEMYYTADERYLVFELTDGYQYDEMVGETHPLTRTSFDKHTIHFDLSGFEFAQSDEDVFKNHYQMLNIEQLDHYIDSLNIKLEDRKESFSQVISNRYFMLSDTTHLDSSFVYDTVSADPFYDLTQQQKLNLYITAINLARGSKSFTDALARELDSRQRRLYRYHIEWHRKLTLSISCILMFLIGAPLGAIIRKGGLGMPVVISVVFFLIFHVTGMSSEKIVRQGELEPYIGMWISSLVLFPIGIYLTYKATTDSVLLDSTYYTVLMDWVKTKIFRPFRLIFIKQKRKNSSL